MKARILKQMLEQLPDVYSHPNDFCVLSYFPATVKNLRLINLEKNPGHSVPAVEIYFRKSIDQNGLDWQLVDINILKLD